MRRGVLLYINNKNSPIFIRAIFDGSGSWIRLSPLLRLETFGSSSEPAARGSNPTISSRHEKPPDKLAIFVSMLRPRKTARQAGDFCVDAPHVERSQNLCLGDGSKRFKAFVDLQGRS
jgi:hypothetical protein